MSGNVAHHTALWLQGTLFLAPLFVRMCPVYTCLQPSGALYAVSGCTESFLSQTHSSNSVVLPQPPASGVRILEYSSVEFQFQRQNGKSKKTQTQSHIVWLHLTELEDGPTLPQQSAWNNCGHRTSITLAWVLT